MKYRAETDIRLVFTCFNICSHCYCAQLSMTSETIQSIHSLNYFDNPLTRKETLHENQRGQECMATGCSTAWQFLPVHLTVAAASQGGGWEFPPWAEPLCQGLLYTPWMCQLTWGGIISLCFVVETCPELSPVPSFHTLPTACSFISNYPVEKN